MSSKTPLATYIKRRRIRTLLIFCEVILCLLLMRQLFLLSMSRLNQYRYPYILSMKLKPKPNEEWMEFRVISVFFGSIAYSTDRGRSCIPVKLIKYSDLTRRLYPRKVSVGAWRRVQPTDSEQAYIDTYVAQNWPKYAIFVKETSEFISGHRITTCIITFALFATLSILLCLKMGSRYRNWIWIGCMLPCSYLLILVLSAYRWPEEFTVFFLITFIFGVVGIVSLAFATWYERHHSKT